MTLAQLILPLAQADAPRADFGPWLANAMYVILSAAGVVGGLAAWKSYREKPAETPQPLMVQQHAEFVQKPDFDKAMREAHGRIARERIEINAAISAQAAATADLADKIDRNNEAGSERESRINGRIDLLGDKVGEMPGKIVTLLRQTKDLL